jgi:glycosyltransferase involved in cell wall biosynthesis
MKSSLIILTRNEIEGIKNLFEKIPINSFDECFVVDFKSTDGTVEFLKEKGIKIIFQEKPGRGEAFRLAYQKSIGDILVFFSPDGNEDPLDTVKLVELIKKGNDMAIASRFLPQSRNDESDKIIPLRAWANQTFTLLANLFFSGSLTDSINGFRAIRKEKFDELNLDASGFAIEYQMSIRALKLRHKIIEIPTLENERIGGESTAKSWSTGVKLLEILFKEALIGKKFKK